MRTRPSVVSTEDKQYQQQEQQQQQQTTTNKPQLHLLVVLHVPVRKRPPHISASRFIYFFSLSTVFCPYSHSFIATCLSFASCSLPFVTVSYYSSHCSPSRQLIPRTSPSPGSLPPQHVINPEPNDSLLEAYTALVSFLHGNDDLRAILQGIPPETSS